MVKVAEVTDIDITEQEMLKRVARFKSLKSTAKSFIDTRIPGHEREIYNIIGQGVVEDPEAKPPIAPQDFHLSIVAASPGKVLHCTRTLPKRCSCRWLASGKSSGDPMASGT